MPRTIKEWAGKNDDAAIPDRVRLRVLERFGFRCDPAVNGCGREIRPGDGWTADHIEALINGGPNRETNLHPLCEWCNPKKNASDVAEKSVVYQKKLSHYGGKSKKSRMPGSRNSPWKQKIGGAWVRR